MQRKLQLSECICPDKANMSFYGAKPQGKPVAGFTAVVRAGFHGGETKPRLPSCTACWCSTGTELVSKVGSGFPSADSPVES